MSLALPLDMDLAFYDDPEQIEKIWCRLETAARPPYALSWGWIENALALQNVTLPLAVLHDHDGDPIAAAFDDGPVLRAPQCPALGLTTTDVRIFVDGEVVTPHVDLDTVRAVEGGYLSTQPAVLRAHLLHTRLQAGELDVQSVTDAPRAHAMFDELLDLKGAPDHPVFRRLIDRRAPFGEIQLLRVRGGEATLGILFEVTWHARIAYLLAGFAASADADLCHTAAIEHAAASGLAFYELQPEDARLATGESRQVTLRLELQQRASSRLAG